MEGVGSFQYGDIFTFVLLGCHTTVYLGTQGNEFILNGKLKDVNAEEIYSPLTTPVFGSDVVYDCPNSKLMEQKKFIKFGLTQSALESHVALIEKEVLEYLEKSSNFQGTSGEVDISTVMAEITIFTAGSALQGEEVRSKLTAEFAALYHDLDKGFSPINFMLPWAPPGLGNSQVDIAKMAPSGYKLNLLSVFSISSSTSPRTQTSTDPIRKQRKADHLHLQFDTTTHFQSPMPLSMGPTHRVPRADE